MIRKWSLIVYTSWLWKVFFERQFYKIPFSGSWWLILELIHKDFSLQCIVIVDFEVFYSDIKLKPLILSGLVFCFLAYVYTAVQSSITISDILSSRTKVEGSDWYKSNSSIERFLKSKGSSLSLSASRRL